MSNILKYGLLGTLGFAALAIAPQPAAAGVKYSTATWCKPRPTADQTILASESSALTWRADGKLALEPISVSSADATIWSSTTGEQLCWEANGRFAVKDAAGATVWSYGGNGIGLPSGDFKVAFTPRLSACDLSSTYIAWEKASTSSPQQGPQPEIDLDPITGIPVQWIEIGKGTQWTRANACPVFSESNAVNGAGWCFDTSEERLLVRTEMAELVWRTNGGLELVGSGIRAGQLIWGSGTTGAGKKVCFDDTGKLEIFDGNNSSIFQRGGAATTTDYLLGLERCDLSITPLDGSPRTWSEPKRCPQEYLAAGAQYSVGASDAVILENQVARLVLDTSGNLVLRSRSGDAIWTSGLAPGTGKTFKVQTNRTLAIYGADNLAKWSVTIPFGNPNKLELDGCSFAFKDGTFAWWSRGSATCEQRNIPINSGWEPSGNAALFTSGDLTILRSAEANLVWRGDGNLVLSSAGGQKLWASETTGSDRSLHRQSDGNLVIYKTIQGWLGPSYQPIWASNSGGGTRRLELADNCTLRVTDGTNAIATLHDSCKVKLYSFEHGAGNDTFGTWLTSAMTATTNTSRLDASTKLLAKIFGSSFEVFSATAYQTKDINGSSLETAKLTIGGGSEVSINFSHDHKFLKYTRTFMVGIVPVVVHAAARAQLGLAVSFESGNLKVTPEAAVEAEVSVGLGAGSNEVGMSVGIKGTLTIIGVSLPISMRIFTENSQLKLAVKGDLELETLSGALAVFAEAHLLLFSIEWTYELFSWTGLRWVRPLFSKTEAF